MVKNQFKLAEKHRVKTTQVISLTQLDINVHLIEERSSEKEDKP
jgi:hypothetical protein